MGNLATDRAYLRIWGTLPSLLSVVRVQALSFSILQRKQYSGSFL